MIFNCVFIFVFAFVYGCEYNIGAERPRKEKVYENIVAPDKI
jgi:hypothetical protein